MPLYTQHSLQVAPRRLGLGEYTGVVPWTPREIGSLRLWLDASNPNNVFSDYTGTSQCTNGQKVSRWKSYVGGDATVNGAAYQPIYYVNQVNGYGSIVFGSENDTCRMTASYSVASISYPSTVALAVNLISVNNVNSYDYLWCGSSGYGLWQWNNATTSSVPPQLFNGAILNGSSAATFGRFTSLFGVFNAGSSLMRQKETTLASGNTGNASQGIGSWIELGNYPGTTRGTHCSIVEVAVWDRALSLAEINQMEAYWKLKYNLIT